MSEINIEALLKAQAVFEDFRQHLRSDQEKAGAIQAFEFCYELAWKTMKRALKEKGIAVGSPKDAFREGALNYLIDDPEVWFDFVKKRNLTVYTYNPSYREEVICCFDTFSEALSKFIETLR